MSGVSGQTAYWQPFTRLGAEPPPLHVVRAAGAYIELADGRRLLDAISSWWVTLHGHARPEIAAAVASQATQLEQVIAAGFTHEPAERLAQDLADGLPVEAAKVFYSDNGSTAVEVALKMAFQFWQNQGIQGRRRFLAFDAAYHGDTVGAMSLSARSLFTDAFGSLLFDVNRVPFPATWSDDVKVQGREDEALARLEVLLEQDPQAYAAMIIEPLVQGAGGMRMCRPSFLVRLHEVLRRYGVLAIYDEVMTGFGRTGELFACIKAGTSPDIVCLAKGLSGGFVPLAATVCSGRIQAAFCSERAERAFYHGHSYTANPIGCAAGLVSWQLLQRERERFVGMEAWHRQEMEALAGHPRLKRMRLCGTVAAVDIETATLGGEGYTSALGPHLRQAFIERGLLLRPLGNTVYVLPPYCLERGELAAIYRAIVAEAEAL
jgi:adenosylmethionine---8-amino-7-oxononanoate aminotransferase